MRRALFTLFVALGGVTSLAAQEAPAWSVTVGGGAMVVPKYTGSDEHRLFPLPLTQVTYRNRIYLGPSAAGNGFGLGAYAVRSRRVGLVAEAGFLSDRPADRADALAGMEDRDFVVTGSVGLSYSLGHFEAALSATQGLNDDAGLMAGARLSYTQHLSRRLMATVGAGATFANARQMRWDFGVSSTEAARRQALIDAGDDRLRADEGTPYDPEGGLRNLSATFSLMYFLSQHWAVLGFGGVDRLSDEAAASPLVRRRAQATGGIGIGYRF